MRFQIDFGLRRTLKTYIGTKIHLISFNIVTFMFNYSMQLGSELRYCALPVINN